jgi:hypothetical protein
LFLVRSVERSISRRGKSDTRGTYDSLRRAANGGEKKRKRRRRRSEFTAEAQRQRGLEEEVHAEVAENAEV